MTKAQYFATVADLNTKLADALEVITKLKNDPIDGLPHDLNAWEEIEAGTLRIAHAIPYPFV